MLAMYASPNRRAAKRWPAAGALLGCGGLLLALLCPAWASPSLPPRTQITYNLSKGSLPVATVSEVLELASDGYSITSEARAAGWLALLQRGAITRSSRGKIGPEGLRPGIFRDQRTDRPATVARFDWERKTLFLEQGEQRASLPLPPGTQDRLSFPYGFAFAPPAGSEIKLSMTDGKRITDYLYRIKGKERLSTPMGELETLHLVRQKAPDEAGTELWLAIQHHLLPVRILVIEEDGGTLDQVATRISY